MLRQVGRFFIGEGRCVCLQNGNNKPVKDRRWKVAVNCNERSCTYQFKGECRAYRLDRRNGTFECPYEDTRRLREFAPAYKPQDARRRS